MKRIGWDGPLWGLVALLVVFASMLGCFGFALSHGAAGPQADILTTDDCPPPADL